jgi:hypothetical protein
MMRFGFTGTESSDFIATVLIPLHPHNESIVLMFAIKNVAEGMNISDANTN